MHELSAQSLSLLRAAGWTPDVARDVRDDLRALADAGHVVSLPAHDLLRTFGGLHFANPVAVPPAATDWHFDVHTMLRTGGTRARVLPYVHRLERELCPIGRAFRNHLLLLISDDGILYGGHDDVLLLVGTSAPDALNALSSGRRLEAV